MDFDKLRSAGYLTNHLARLFAHALHGRIAPLGLAPAQFMTLLELWESDALTQVELVSRLDVEQATMANTLTRMERDGLIRRAPHPDDRRARLVFLTDRARALRTPAIEAARSVNSDMLEPLDPEERDMLVGLLARVVSASRTARRAAEKDAEE
ncbi:MarR family transcriptional regulator [Maricaulis sp.]|uniref:MarR family winged helix-turn-helix transcriptional regulator n=1 Tax=Maricaulis sp. TaxID=1486257 RepID=UPI003296ED89